MFGPNHYIPILRWKGAEKEALTQLKPEAKRHITPLIELIMPVPKPDRTNPVQESLEELREKSITLFQKKLLEVPDEIFKCWGRDPVFIDLHLIDGSIRAQALEKILDLGERSDLFLIPVINIIPIVDFQSDVKTREVAINFAKKWSRGLCLRLSPSDLTQESISPRIQNFLEKAGLKAEDVDLIVDLLIVDAVLDPGVLSNLVSRIPNIETWRTFILASGAFPQDLSKFNNPDKYEIQRSDWISWLTRAEELKRRPSFADYTIQHPKYKEPPRNANPSASIRYALEDKWIIMKGQALFGRKSAGFAQYPANAKLLVSLPEFKGAGFSSGDAYIAATAENIKTKKPGNPKTWLRAGINHHMTLVANQVSSFSLQASTPGPLYVASSDLKRK